MLKHPLSAQEISDIKTPESDSRFWLKMRTYTFKIGPVYDLLQLVKTG